MSYFYSFDYSFQEKKLVNKVGGEVYQFAKLLRRFKVTIKLSLAWVKVGFWGN